MTLDPKDLSDLHEQMRDVNENPNLLALREFLPYNAVGSQVLYEKCLHCHLFVEPNDAWVPDQKIMPYIHLSRGNDADERFEDHEPAPSGMLANLTAWQVFGPSAMRERFVTGKD